MSLLETLLGAQSGSAVQQVAKSVGIGENDARSAIEQLIPALSRGLERNAAAPGGLDKLMGALSNGNHQQYLDNPATLDGQGAISDGNAILGHIFGSKDVSRNVAGHAAKQSGLSSTLLKKALPLVAAIAMGALSKQGGATGMLGKAMLGGTTANAAMGMLGKFLDADKDGSVADDLLNLAKKFF